MDLSTNHWHPLFGETSKYYKIKNYNFKYPID